ncbi:peptidylprolyl isomerase [Deinococcus detaillensis]|nr:peptidylprolyl isomerase [Deinococcus detaillensis]
MNISDNKVVEIEYTLTIDGEVVDRSESGEPLTYLQGHGNIVSGLEKALKGKSAGDHVKVTVQPEDGYGEHDDEAIQIIAREDFDDDIEVGATYFAQAEDGSVTPFTVMGLDGDDVTVDFNPPLAGEVLNFDVFIKSVRDATEDELAHGHVHNDDDLSKQNPNTQFTGESMNISNDKVVEIEYTLTVNGEVVDKSESGEPLTYLQGHGNIIPGLEKALDGKSAGDHMMVTVQPEDGYGERDEEAIQVIAREDFEDDIEVGATYFAQAEDGSVTPFTVMGLDGDDVTVDFNQPLAGEVLNFDVTIKSVRDATADELAHGHVHDDDDDQDDEF